MSNFKYVSMINSKDLNDNNNEIINKIESLSVKINSLYNEQKEFDLINTIGSTYLELAINDMYRELDSSNSKIIVRPDKFVNIENTFINKEKLYANRESANTINKLTISDNNNVFIATDLILEAVSDDVYISINDNDIYNIVEEKNKPWLREIVADNSVNEVYTTLYIYIPNSVSTNNLVNEMSFDLFPFKSTEIVNIEYSKNYDLNRLMSFEEIKNHKGCVMNDYSITSNSSMNSVILNFNDIDAKLIAITLKQSKPIVHENYKKFYLGLKNLNILYKEYIEEPMSFYIDVEPSSPDGVRINGYEIIYNSNTVTDPMVQISELNGDLETILYNSFVPFTTNEKTIRFKFKYSMKNNPNINKIIFYITQ